MPRDSSGVYSQPASTAAVSRSPISSAAFNNLISDIAGEITDSLPTSGTVAMTAPLKSYSGTVSAPGWCFSASTSTGLYKTPDGFGVAVAGVKVAEFTAAGVINASGSPYVTASVVAWADIASAATTDIGAVNSGNLRVTGTTTITGFGTAATGTTRTLRFAGILTLTHNATSLILPGAANITTPGDANIITAANDTCTAVSLGAGNWIVTDYQRASGLPIVSPSVSAVTSVTAGVGLTGGTITSSGTIAINTDNNFGVGAYAILQNNTGGILNAAATAAGTSLNVIYWNSSGVLTSAGASSGTWRNVSGANLVAGTSGLFIRTA